MSRVGAWLTKQRVAAEERAAERIPPRDAAVFGALVLLTIRGQRRIFVTDLWHRLGGSVGSIYLSLARLERDGTVTSGWYLGPDPRRRYYEVADRYLPASVLNAEEKP